MAGVENIIGQGLRGSVGKALVFKKRKTGKIYASKHPSSPTAKSSKKQARRRTKFVEAIRFAKMVIKDPLNSQHFRIKKGKTLYNAAVSAYMKELPIVAQLQELQAGIKKTTGEAMNQRQEKALKWLIKKKTITNSEYQRITKSSKPTATRDLQDLVKRHLLEPSGIPGAGAFYSLPAPPAAK